jgi:hypothetical protein
MSETSFLNILILIKQFQIKINHFGAFGIFFFTSLEDFRVVGHRIFKMRKKIMILFPILIKSSPTI